MGTIILLSGPVGAGKTTVARELVALWPDPVAHIEGDVFWSFLAKPSGPRARNFPVIMRAMTAAAVPLARSGYDVLLDFSIPPEFCDTARKIARELPLALVVIKPAERVCADRAARRAEGAIPDYAVYHDFYQMFTAAGRHTLDDDEATPAQLAGRIRDGYLAGRFALGDGGTG